MSKSRSLIKMEAYINLHNRLKGGSLALQEEGESYLREEPLPFPTQEIMGPANEPIIEYIIPDDAKAQVLLDLYPFTDPPCLTDILWDIHEQKFFKVKDFKVIRECDLNLLVSPWFSQSGGSVLDWTEKEPSHDADCFIATFCHNCSNQNAAPCFTQKKDSNHDNLTRKHEEREKTEEDKKRNLEDAEGEICENNNHASSPGNGTGNKYYIPARIKRDICTTIEKVYPDGYVRELRMVSDFFVDDEEMQHDLPEKNDGNSQRQITQLVITTTYEILEPEPSDCYAKLPDSEEDDDTSD